MTDAAITAGTDPDRASFTIALETAKEQVTNAAGIAGTSDPSDTGRIGAAVLARPLPARRPRYSARKVKCPTSRYSTDNTDRPALPVTITRVQITITAPPPDRPAAGPRWKPSPAGRPPTPQEQVSAIMASHPGTSLSAADLATRLGITTHHMRKRLARWARQGHITRTSPARYTLPAPATTGTGP